MKKQIITLYILFFVTIILLNSSKGSKLFINETFVVTKSSVSHQGTVGQGDLDKFYSNKKLGSFVEDGKTIFRLFAPTAQHVKLCLFNKPKQKTGQEYLLTKDENGVWEISLNGELYGKYYGYKVYHEGDDISNENKPICVDPYAKAVTSFTTYMNPRRAIVVKEKPFDWAGTEWIKQDWRDLIIYEMHVRDMTEDKSSGAKHRGSYRGLTEKGIRGGLDYIKSLGVNTVELLPTQEYGVIEIPYRDSMDGRFNTWNPYGRNYWGYMTSNFFAQCAYYNESWNELKWNKWIGKDADQINGFKSMVKAFHKDGIAVIMDVVYNHLSEYEIGNLKQIDKEYYFRLDDNGNYTARSGCGNDLKTERPMVRRLIVESILYWMKEYHVDGFRFDLGTLINYGTIDAVVSAAKKINPNVVFVCEPWGGAYDPKGVTQHGWGAWNDQIRNGIKGENPNDGLGWIFGHWYGNNSPQRIKSYVNGTLLKDSLGLFSKKNFSVNYLESHDGYTFGDFIRIGSREVDHNKIIKDVDKSVKLTPLQTKLNKLGALFLFTSQGVTMIQEGQEFARTKVVPNNLRFDDPNRGKIDHNSYNKDNATNYINYKHAAINKDLVDYYKGLIELRKTYDAFRHADYSDITFRDNPKSQFGLAYTLKYQNQNFFVLFNADPNQQLEFSLPDGKWEVLVDKHKAGIKPLYDLEGSIKLEPTTGAVLKLK